MFEAQECPRTRPFWGAASGLPPWVGGSLQALAVGFLVSGLLLSAGCRTSPLPAPHEPVFYPPAPEPPRFQYLTSISSPADVIPGPSPLMTFLFGPPPRPAALVKPYGLAAKNGKLYVSDSFNGTIHIADLRNHTWEYFKPTGRGRLRKNIGVAVDDDGTLYVSDTVRGQVIVFNAAGKCVGEIGKPGELKPTALELSTNGLYVADMLSRRVLLYDKNSHAVLDAVPRAGVTNAEEVLYQPMGLARDPEGRLFVSDAGAFRIQVYGPDGGYLRTIGMHGDAPGQFVRNKGLALDRDRRLYSVDAGFQIIQLFDDQARMLMYFGEPDAGAEGQMQLPADVVIDYDDTAFFRKFVAPGHDIEFVVLVSNQYGSGKIGVYGFLRPEAASAPNVAAGQQMATP